MIGIASERKCKKDCDNEEIASRKRRRIDGESFFGGLMARQEEKRRREGVEEVVEEVESMGGEEVEEAVTVEELIPSLAQYEPSILEFLPPTLRSGHPSTGHFWIRLFTPIL